MKLLLWALLWTIVLYGLTFSPAHALAEGDEAAKIDLILRQLGEANALCMKQGKSYSCADAASAIAYRYELSGSGIRTAQQFVQTIAPAKEYQMQFSGGKLTISTTEFLREALQKIEARQ